MKKNRKFAHLPSGMKKAGIMWLSAFCVMAVLVAVCALLDAACGIEWVCTLMAGGAAAAGGLPTPGTGQHGVVTAEDAEDNPANLFVDSVDDKITEIYKEETPLLWILENASRRKLRITNGEFSRVHRFYQVGERPDSCLTAAAYTQGASTIATLQLTADTINFWTRDSIIIPCTPKAGGGYEFVDGYDYSENPAGAVKGSGQRKI
jgi:hypothetical protein